MEHRTGVVCPRWEGSTSTTSGEPIEPALERAQVPSLSLSLFFHQYSIVWRLMENA